MSAVMAVDVTVLQGNVGPISIDEVAPAVALSELRRGRPGFFDRTIVRNVTGI
jgi:hypothetical protein